MTGPAPISMLSDVLQILLGDVAMLLCFFAPGYVAAWATDVMAFRSRSLPEKVLWAIALSAPITILVTCYVARALPAGVIVALFQLTFVAALGLLARDFRSASREGTLTLDRSFWIVTAAMVGVAIYCIAATLGITTQHSLYESIVMADWSIRVPLTEAAARGGLPPHNPMYAIEGVAPPMRYYYFWYELCALIMRITHISARAALTATTAWSAYSLTSVLFLTIKYLGNLRTQPHLWPKAWPSSPSTTAPAPTAPLRRICVMAIGLSCVMSLDLIMAMRYVLMRPPIVFPDIEAWHSDRMPSWVGSILFAPHHIAGVAFGVLGFLLLAVLPASHRQRITHSLLAAVCFAALVGTSHLPLHLLRDRRAVSCAAPRTSSAVGRPHGDRGMRHRGGPHCGPLPARDDHQHQLLSRRTPQGWREEVSDRQPYVQAGSEQLACLLWRHRRLLLASRHALRNAIAFVTSCRSS